jgi:hypothetical protein
MPAHHLLQLGHPWRWLFVLLTAPQAQLLQLVFRLFHLTITERARKNSIHQ